MGKKKRKDLIEENENLTNTDVGFGEMAIQQTPGLLFASVFSALRGNSFRNWLSLYVDLLNQTKPRFTAPYPSSCTLDLSS